MSTTVLSTAVLGLTCLLATATLTSAQNTVDGSVGWKEVGVSEPKHYFGDGTYYGANQDDAGSCGYGPAFANSLDLDWKEGLDNYIALNAAQYYGGAGCGLCVMYRGLGEGLGMKPIPGDWKMAMVNNQCPECAFGSIDLALTGDGRWKTEWYPVECNVGAGTFRYDMQGSPSQYWFAFTVSNTRVPIENVEMEQNGAWYSMRRSIPDNHWAANGGPFKFPINIRLTSVRNDTVTDTVPSLSGGQGKAQFPSNAAPGAAAAPANATSNATQSTSESLSAGAAAGRRMLGLPVGLA